MGGLGLCNPTTLLGIKYPASKAISAPLSELIIQHSQTYSANIHKLQIVTKASAVRSHHELTMFDLATIKEQLPNPLCYSVELAQEKGASSWLSVLPLEEFGFFLHKGAFRDALALQYGWNPSVITTKSEIQLPACWLMYAMMFRLSPNYNHSLEKPSPSVLPTLGQDSTLWPVGFGVADLNVPSLMSGYLTHMLFKTVRNPCQPRSKEMKGRSKADTNRESVKWNMHHSPLW